MSLIVENLRKSYGDKVVVDDLSFSVGDSGVYALLGTNGAGKTTSIRMMLNMLARDGGTVLWNGNPLSVDTCNVGYLAEERGLYPKYRLLDQLTYFARLRGVSAEEASKRIRNWAERLQAEEYLYPTKVMRGRETKLPSMKAEQLSKGNQQKIQLIAALISDPELIVLDEPLSGLDPVNTDLFKDIIRDEIARGKTLIMSSHQMATVEEFCTNITIMDKSKTVLQGDLNAIKKSLGRVHLSIKTEGDAASCIRSVGVEILSQKENEYSCKVTGEEQANKVLLALMQARLPIIRFDLREPSLHEIFVSKVGKADA